MAFILNIDTATEEASVCLSRDTEILGMEKSGEQKNHAAFLHPAIRRLLTEQQLAPKSLDAVAVTAGPGSYTGLRVGLSSAKGLCYALRIPLVLVPTLEVMAVAAIQANPEVTGQKDKLFCPMIDARRMEVFTAVYDRNLTLVMPPAALILDENSFTTFFGQGPLIFSGSGAGKFQQILTLPDAVFSTIRQNATHLAVRSLGYYQEKRFPDLAYCEPYYLKEFYTPPPAGTK